MPKVDYSVRPGCFDGAVYTRDAQPMAFIPGTTHKIVGSAGIQTKCAEGSPRTWDTGGLCASPFIPMNLVVVRLRIHN